MPGLEFMASMPAPLTVAQVLDFVPNGKRSMDAFLLLLTDRLRRTGWRTVFVFAGEPAPAFREALASLDAPYLVQTLPGPIGSAWQLGRRLRAFGPAVVQTHFISKFERNLLPLRLACGAPHLLVTDHSSGSASTKWGVGRLLARARGRLAARYVDHVICVSEFVRRRDVEQVHFPGAQVSVVYNGVDVERYAPAPRAAHEAFKIAFAGQLIAQKGVSTLLRAVALLRARGCPVELDIAGIGPHEAALRQECAQWGLAACVRFLGHIDGVHRLFCDADAVVVPSEWEEAFGFVVAEAAACGACLVVSDAGALPEIVGTDGRAGLVFRRGDASDLARTLLRVWTHPEQAESMRRGARELARARFSLQSMVEGYGSYFDALSVRLRR